MSSNDASLKDFFLSFFKLGMGVFGGPAMVAFIKELSVKKSLA